MGYVEQEELRAAWEAEPTGRYRRRLEELGVLTAAAASDIDSSCAEEVAGALERALQDPEPGTETLLEDVTAPTPAAGSR
jgi:TPP-dependent pyruvate/acetoin dehydrogenase alpha subunit